MKVYMSDPEVVAGREKAAAFFRADRTARALRVQYLGTDTTGRGSGWLLFARDGRRAPLFIGHYETLVESDAAFTTFEADAPSELELRAMDGDR